MATYLLCYYHNPNTTDVTKQTESAYFLVCGFNRTPYNKPLAKLEIIFDRTLELSRAFDPNYYFVLGEFTADILTQENYLPILREHFPHLFI